jgi:hypothetical protein
MILKDSSLAVALFLISLFVILASTNQVVTFRGLKYVYKTRDSRYFHGTFSFPKKHTDYASTNFASNLDKYALAVSSPNTIFKIDIGSTEHLVPCLVQYQDGSKWEYHSHLTYDRLPNDKINTALFRANKQIYAESIHLLYERCVFQLSHNKGLIPAFFARLTNLGRNNIIQMRMRRSPGGNMLSIPQLLSPHALSMIRYNNFLSCVACEQLGLFPNLLNCEVGNILPLFKWVFNGTVNYQVKSDVKPCDVFPYRMLQAEILSYNEAESEDRIKDEVLKVPKYQGEAQWFLNLVDSRTASKVNDIKE